MNLGEYLQDKDVKCSANIELALYKLAQDLGVQPSKISLGIYDKEIAECKERIYKAFSNRLRFTYAWDGHYKIGVKDENLSSTN